MMNRSAKGGTRSSLHYEGKGILIHPPYQGVCGWHGTEEQCVTSGGLAESSGGTGVSRPISESEVASHALSVDGRLCSHKRGESRVTGNWAGKGSRRRRLGRERKPDNQGREGGSVP